MGHFFTLMEQGKSPMEALAQTIKDFIILFLPEWISEPLMKLWEWFNNLLDLGPMIAGWVAGPVGAFLATLKNIWEIVTDLATGEKSLEDILPDWVIELWDRFQGVIVQFGDWWTRNGPEVSDAIGKLFGTIGTLAKDMGENVSDWAVDSLERFADWFDDNEMDIIEALQSIASWFETDFAPAVKNAWDQVIRPVLDALITLLLRLGDVALEVMQGDWAEAWESAGDTVSGFLGDGGIIRNIIQGFLDWFVKILTGMGPEEFKGAMFDMQDWGAEMLWKWINGMTGNFKAGPMPEWFSGEQTSIPQNYVPPEGRGGFPGVATQTNTNNYNLTVNTSAPSEPIIQDLNMIANIGR
jgi:hypothetical protein